MSEPSFSIRDRPDIKGIDLEVDLNNGIALTIFMTDQAAQDLINIIQNKLNGRVL